MENCLTNGNCDVGCKVMWVSDDSTSGWYPLETTSGCTETPGIILDASQATPNIQGPFSEPKLRDILNSNWTFGFDAFCVRRGVVLSCQVFFQCNLLVSTTNHHHTKECAYFFVIFISCMMTPIRNTPYSSLIYTQIEYI